MWAVTGSGWEAGTSSPLGRSTPASTFDVCHVGVVLRVVLGVQAVLWLGALQGSASPMDWLARWAQASAVGLPGSLLWLLGVCAARHGLGRLGAPLQWAAVVVWGGLAGAYGHLQFAMLDWWLGLRSVGPWAVAGPVAVGGALAAVCLGWLRQRHGRADPAQTQARLAELQARIRPHFLFNTLNTAIALVQVDPDRAESVLEDLAELFRQALSSPSTQSTLSQEVDLARRYLGIEQLRFGERLSVAWHVPEDAARALLPALLLQPLVENAVKHGVESDPQGGWVRVEAQRQGNRVVLTVSNSVAPASADGSLAGAARGHGIALRNVRQRLQLMHDVEADFEAGLRPLTPGDARLCFVVRMTLPMVTSS